jgi:hypothetical protein
MKDLDHLNALENSDDRRTTLQHSDSPDLNRKSIDKKRQKI